MKFELKPYNRNTPDKELLNDLRKVAADYGGKLTMRSYEISGKFSTMTFKNRFGSWNLALKAAGIEPSVLAIISDELLFENIEEVWLKLGRQPKLAEMKSPLSRFSHATYHNRFGTWYKALEKFVELANGDVPESESESEVEEANVVDSSNAIAPHKTKRDINWRMRWQVLDRDNFRCVSCGLSPAIAPGTILHVDHIKPWSKGGETVLENLQTLCATCNLGKGNTE